MEGVRNWVGRLQREDGSFGEWVLEGGLGGGEDGVKMARVCGGRDMRYVYFAAALRALLGEGDWDVEKTVNYVVESQTYDGGIAEMPFHEAHGESLFPLSGAEGCERGEDKVAMLIGVTSNSGNDVLRHRGVEAAGPVR